VTVSKELSKHKLYLVGVAAPDLEKNELFSTETGMRIMNYV
jgi:hypothetical protein